MMTRRISRGEGTLFYVYLTRKNQLSKLLILKAMHLGIFMPPKLTINESFTRDEINDFIKSVKELEREWEYRDHGLWKRRIDNFYVYMVLVIGDDRWTVRAMVSKEGMPGYGVELPVDPQLSEKLMRELTSEEAYDLEIHEHVENRHFHFTVYNVERFIDLVKRYDYYFARKEIWEQSVRIENPLC
ncbi:hypothetical protein DRO38_06970 [Candidatus Bathyarchaeota archaeon]|nr:MAG: hypothetical protein DRO38_06970 [Candidatus Bathyarchaeota archaeon]